MDLHNREEGYFNFHNENYATVACLILLSEKERAMKNIVPSTWCEHVAIRGSPPVGRAQASDNRSF